MENQVEEIKNRLDVVDIIRSYIRLDKSGANFRGLCPFHKEKTPSFFVSPSRQLWKCFGCSVGGDMFSFIQQIEGVEFIDALKTLADKAGVQLRSYDPKIRSEKSRLYEICEKACQFFEKQIQTSSLGAEAMEYLLGRGINKESIDRFRVGFAPDTRSGLSEFLRNQGYSPLEIFKSGVAIQPRGGGCYDRFRGRIQFPIFDLNSQIIGFGGRVFFGKNQVTNKELAKYINTPQTLLYDKSSVLYGLDRAKMSIREKDACIIVEGYTDVIMAHQAGQANVVSTSGTALTDRQLDILHRYTETIITCFDMDIAGNSATRRGIDIAQQKGFNIRVATLPEGKDPAEIIQQNERRWKKEIEKPISIGDFYFQTAFARHDKNTPEGMKEISGVILPMIKKIPSKIESSYWVQKLAMEFGCNESVIWNDLAALKDDPAYASTRVKDSELDKPFPQPEKREKTKQDVLYEHLLVAILKDPTCLAALTKKDAETFFDVKNPHAALVCSMRKAKEFKPTKEQQNFLDDIQFQEEIFPSFDADTDPREEFALCLKSLKQIALRKRLMELQVEMKKNKGKAKAVEEFQKVSITLAKL